MQAIARVCRAVVGELEGGIACGVYVLNAGESDESFSASQADEQALAGLLAMHLQQPERDADVQAFSESAIELLGRRGQRRCAPLSGAQGGALLPGEVMIAGRDYWGFARLLQEKDALIIVLMAPAENTGLGWAALNTAAARVATAL